MADGNISPVEGGFISNIGTPQPSGLMIVLNQRFVVLFVTSPDQLNAFRIDAFCLA